MDSCEYFNTACRQQAQAETRTGWDSVAQIAHAAAKCAIPPRARPRPRTMAKLAAACVQESRAQNFPRALKYWTPVGRVPPRRDASRFRPV